VRILGVDPGLAKMGYSIVNKEGNSFTIVKAGTFTTSADKKDPIRLNNLFNQLSALITEYQPEHMAVEELFFNKNVKTAIRVGQARGVIMLAGSKSGIKVFEYTPLQVKQAVVGYGRASKHQVQQMVKALLNLDELPSSDDEADAIAVAICHGHNFAVQKNWGELI